MGLDRSTAEIPARSYLIGMLGGGLLTLAAIVASLALLAWSNRLPPPPLTKVNFMDEKLHFIREHEGLDPALIVVGSSMALRQFDGEPFETRLGRGRVLNGASTLLKVHQTRFLTSFYMEHFPRLRTIVLMLGPPDFENCTTIPAELFDPEDAAGYAFRRDMAAPLYLSYFAPAFYLARARDYQERHTPFLGDMWVDGYGSSPLQVPQEMQTGMRYGALGFDRACVSALVGMLTEIKARGIRPVVVFSPVHPEYRQQHPETGERLRQVAAEIEPIVRPGVEFFDLNESDFAPSDFFDAVHLQWTAVQRFSTKLADIVLSGKAAATSDPSATSSIADAGEGTSRVGAHP